MESLETLKAGEAMLGGDVDAPGKVRRWPIELLVEKVPPAPDRLRQDQARGAIVCPFEEAKLVPPAERPHAKEPAENRPEDAESGHLQAEHLARPGSVVLPT